MSIFTPTIYNEPSFSGLFRLLDDFDNYRAASSPNANSNTSGSDNVNNNQHQHQHQGRHQLIGPRFHTHLPTFNPKFDLQETATAYELHGELPGIAKDQIHIEFADPHTLTIRGKIERSYNKSSSEDSKDANKANDATITANTNNETPTSTEVTTIAKDQDKQVSSTAPSGFKPRYWISERSVGEFSRSFNLAGGSSGNEEIDHDGVKASLNDGILHVLVPKVKKEEKAAKRKVMIE